MKFFFICFLLVVLCGCHSTAVPDSLALVAEGKRLLEAGRLDEAKTQLQSVLSRQPTNKAARYYLDLVREAEFQLRSSKSVPGHPPLMPEFVPLTRI